jgi:hypothetical protein
MVAMVAADASEQFVAQLSALTTEPAVSTKQVVEALSAIGIGSLPSLAIVLREADGYHLLVRGSSRLGVVTGSEVEWFAAPRAASWSESFRTRANSFCLDVDGGQDEYDFGSGDPSWWCDRGVVPVGRLTVDARHFDAGFTAPTFPAVTPRIGAHERPPTETSVTIVSSPADHTGDEIDSVGSTEAELTSTYLRRLIEETRDRGPETQDIAIDEAGEDAAIADSTDADAGVTQTLNFEDVTAAASADASNTSTSDVPSSIPDGPSPSPAEASLQELISSVPGATASHPSAEERPTRDQFDSLGDHDGHTVSVETLRAATSALGSGTAGPTVQAVHCPSIHPNPPHAERCRTCGAAIRDHTITVITRPVLGELRFDNGDAYPMDRPMLIGRRPSTARDADVGGETARLVTVQDPQNVLSKVHLEVRIEDWQVLVVDRNSTNHTIVTLPERAPTQLHPGDAVRIVPGTLIELGGVARARYEIEV